MSHDDNVVKEEHGEASRRKPRKRSSKKLAFMAILVGILLFVLVFTTISRLSAKRVSGGKDPSVSPGLSITQEKMEEIKKKLSRLSDSNVKNEDPGNDREAENYVNMLMADGKEKMNEDTVPEGADPEKFINHSPDVPGAGDPAKPLTDVTLPATSSPKGDQEPSIMVYSRSRPGNSTAVSNTGNGILGLGNQSTDQMFDMVKSIQRGVGKIASSPSGDRKKDDKQDNDRTGLLEPEMVIYNDLPPVRVFEGEFLDGVILNRIESQIADSPVVASIAKDYFDRNQKYVVIPTGSRMIGNAGTVTQEEQARMIITFHRLILPGGESIQIRRERMIGLADDGSVGVVSKVYEHTWRRYLSALLFGVLDGLSAFTQSKLDQTSRSSFFVGQTSRNFDRINSQLFSKYANILPTITVEAGHKVKIYVSEDVIISPYMLIKERGYAK